VQTDQIGANNVFLYFNFIFFVGFRAERILLGYGYGYGFFRISEMVRNRIDVEAEADLKRSDNTYLHVAF